jgi:hypothetical protein
MTILIKNNNSFKKLLPQYLEKICISIHGTNDVRVDGPVSDKTISQDRPKDDVITKRVWILLPIFEEGCQIFSGTTHQNGVKNIPNNNKIYQMVTKYTKMAVK